VLGFIILNLVLMVGCASQAPVQPAAQPAVVCNAPYILVGADCCLDKDANRICDRDEAPPVPNETIVPVNATPLPEADSVSEADKRLQATNFAQKVARLWEQGAWDEMYTYLPADDKAVLTPKEFEFFMNVTSYQARAVYDQKFQDELYSGYYEFDRRKKLSVTIDKVIMADPKTAVTLATDVKFNDVPMWDWQGFTFSWEDQQWKLNTIGVFFKGNDVDTVCPSLSYGYRCYFEYAKAFDDFSVCGNAGYHIFDCYKHFDRDVPEDVAIGACKSYDLGDEKDICLMNIVLNTKNSALCEEMTLSQNSFVCNGLLAGQTKNLSFCTSKIVEQDIYTKANREAQCIYGYVWVTREYKLCDNIPERAAVQIAADCTNLKFPRME
jgi:hypothetical protein